MVAAVLRRTFGRLNLEVSMRKSIGEKKKPCKNCEGKGTLKKEIRIREMSEVRRDWNQAVIIRPSSSAPRRKISKLWRPRIFPCWVPASLERERAGVGWIPRHRFGPPDRGPFVGHLLCLAERHALFRPHKWQGNVVCDGRCCLLRDLVLPSVGVIKGPSMMTVRLEGEIHVRDSEWSTDEKRDRFTCVLCYAPASGIR